MSKNAAKIRQSLKDLLATGEFVFPVTVKSVDEDTCTIDVVTAEGMDIFEVKLRAVKSEKYGCIIFPKVNTTVQICQINNDNDYLMLHADEVEKIYWKIQDTTKEVTKDGFIYNGGQNDGMVKVKELTQKINALENKVNQIIAQYNSHSHSANGASTTTLVTGTLQVTNKNDLENTKIKH